MKLFSFMLRHRRLSIAVVCAFTAVMAVLAGRVRPDWSLELGFPTFHESRKNYERFKEDFPGEDARAYLMIEAADLYTPAGLRRLAALEADLGRIPGVIATEGPTTSKDIVSDGNDGILLEPVFPSADLAPEELARRRAVITSDPLFAWNLAHPDGKVTVVRIDLAPEHAAKEAPRTAFLARLRGVVSAHRISAASAGVEEVITMGGAPVRRSKYTELVQSDLHRMFPIAFLLTLIILFVAFRRLAHVGAAVATIIVSVIWTTGAMYLAGVPLQMLTQLTPIVVMIVSISDTVHMVHHARDAAARGENARQSALSSVVANAIPCLLTEIVIAGGFLALLTNDMVMIQQFGVVTAVGMMLTWLANVTFLPLALSFVKPRAEKQRARQATSPIGRVVERIEGIVLEHPRRVFVVAGVVSAAGALLATRISSEYVHDADLREESALREEIRYESRVRGGVLPVAIHVAPADGAHADAMLEPEALALVDKITSRVETAYPEDLKTALSYSKYLKKAHRLFAGEEIATGQPLPGTRALVAQELMMIDDPGLMRHLLSFDRGAAAVLAVIPDRGSAELDTTLRSIEADVARLSAGTPYRVTVTGFAQLTDAIFQQLVSGMARSLGFAILLSFAAFALVLRSWKLALIALVPNLLPLLVCLALMSLLGIPLKPSTVVLFSITLVIADDDTIQYMTRFRRAFLRLSAEGHADPHREAALEAHRETGAPMITTTFAIAVGFLVLLGSEFLGLSHLGLLVGVSLASAALADLFLSPLLIMKIRPRIGRSDRRVAARTSLAEVTSP